MADHKHGMMDISEQEKSFEGLITWLTRGAIVTFVVLILLALFNA